MVRYARYLTLALVALYLGAATTSVSGKVEPAAPAPADPPRSTKALLFAVMYRPGPAWRPGVPMSGQALREHVAYYRAAAASGRVFAGGALPAIDGGLAILVLPDLQAARAFLSADPAILNGTFVGEVNLWQPAVRTKKPLP